MKIIVTTDSTSDISNEFQKKYEISVMPLTVNLGNDEFLDGKTITNEDIFEFVEKKNILPKTAARSPQQYKEFFEEAIKLYNADKVIHISLSSELSSSYQNAKLATEGDDRVEVIDSLSLSSGSGLLVLSAVDKIKQGKTFEEIVGLIKEEVNKVQASFILNDLRYLYKGGRCSALSVLGANILRIKPKIKLADGKMGVDKKYMGKLETVIDKYVDDLLNDHPNPIKNRVFVTYTSTTDNINNSIKTKLEEKGFKEIIFNTAGSTIASHCGKNCLGVLFIDN